jgi:hypothetical protein
MDHAMIASRARVLTRPGVDVLRLWIDSASSGEFAKSSPAQQAGTLYAAALSAKELRDYKTARALAERLVARTADDPAAAKLARWLSAEIELAAGAAPKAAALLDAKSKERPEMLLAAEAATAMRQPAPMIPVLRDWVAANPRDATAWHALANLYGAGTTRCARCAPTPRPTWRSSTTRPHATGSRPRRSSCASPGSRRPLRGVDHRHPRAGGGSAGEAAGRRAAAEVAESANPRAVQRRVSSPPSADSMSSPSSE